MTENLESVNNWEPTMDITAFHSFAGSLDHLQSVTWGPYGYAYIGGEGGQIPTQTSTQSCLVQLQPSRSPRR